MENIIISIISGIFSIVVTVITAIVAPLILKDKGNRSDEVERSKSKVIPGLAAMILVIGAVFAVLLSIGGALSWPVATGLVIGAVLGYLLAIRVIHLSCLPFAPPSVAIASPERDSKVPRTISVQGTSCHIRNSQKLWVFLKPDEDYHYYPAPEPSAISGDGTWSAMLTIGSANPSGEGFQVYAVLANQEVSAIIQQIASDLTYPGFPDALPNGAQISSQVHVILQ